MGNYHNHYMKKDVLLLADVFEKFIDTCMTFYGLSWDELWIGFSWNELGCTVKIEYDKIRKNIRH